MSITEYIKSDLAARISAGCEQDATLTLIGIASHYSVSVTPVRAVVQELIDEGILRKGANRRLEINQEHVNASAKVTAKVTAKTVAASEAKHLKASVSGARGAIVYQPDPVQRHVQEISDHLVGLSLEGEPIFLREEATAKQFGITRSAVRQIFISLAGHGMITHIPRRGWQIRPLREKDLDEYTEVRITLELLALRLARPHLVADDVRKILDGNRLPKTPSDEPMIDDSLHQYIIQKADNHYIADFFERQSKYFSLLFDWEALDRKTRTQTVRQHRDILDAILRKDWPLAESALRFHIQHNHPLLRKRMRERACSGSS